MTELKTLKDLECMGETHGYRPKWINEEELKSEAVKWLKQDRYTIFDKEWIKHFFNLTEEDLNKQEAGE